MCKLKRCLKASPDSALCSGSSCGCSEGLFLLLQLPGTFSVLQLLGFMGSQLSALQGDALAHLHLQREGAMSRLVGLHLSCQAAGLHVRRSGTSQMKHCRPRWQALVGKSTQAACQHGREERREPQLALQLQRTAACGLPR